jgi:hypothetical protein
MAQVCVVQRISWNAEQELASTKKKTQRSAVCMQKEVFFFAENIPQH